jgi:hypothetical protein
MGWLMSFGDNYFIDGPRNVIPSSEHDVIMMTADRRYWTDPVWRRNVNEFLRYFKSLEAEVVDFIDADYRVKGEAD